MESLECAGDESMEDVVPQVDLVLNIAEHAKQCQSLFHEYMVVRGIVPDHMIIDDQRAHFSTWARDMEVFGPSNVSLDYRLRFSPTAKIIIHELLDHIYHTLRSLRPINDRPHPDSSNKRRRTSVHGNCGVTRRADDDTSHSASYVDPARENKLKITDTIGRALTRLCRLSYNIRDSVEANRAREAKTYIDDEEASKAIDELRLYTKCYIESRFPKAPEALRSALVEANALRLRRLCYRRSHPMRPLRRRIDLTTTSPETTPALVNNKLQQCPCCGLIFEFKNTAESLLWQNHVMEDHVMDDHVMEDHVMDDLEPFICLFSPCPEKVQHGHGIAPLTFETSKAWYSHMQTAHGQLWECKGPSHDPITFDQETKHQEHIIKEHGVTEAQSRNFNNMARRPVILNKVLECPFGDHFAFSGKAEPTAVFSSEALESHIAGHMKEIALLVLRELLSDDDEQTENVESDQPSEDAGPSRAFEMTRASEYSVLDDEDLDFQHDDGGEAADGKEGHREEGISARMTVLRLEDKDRSAVMELHRAVVAGDLDRVESLIESGANVNLTDEYGQTPLHYAAEWGVTSVKCIEVLVKHGADLHITDNSGFPPLLWAVIAGEKSTTEELLLMGADPNSSSADGKSALAWAAGLGWFPLVEMLLQHGANPRNTQNTWPLQEAAAFGDLDSVRLLLDRGHDPNHRDRDGWSAIHLAAEQGHLEIVRVLLGAGANPNAVSSYGTSPLHCAANGDHYHIVHLLLEHGADPLKSTCHGWTALHHAVFMGQALVLRRLIADDRVRSSASQRDNHGWSVLHLAVHRRHVKTVRALLHASDIAAPQTLFDEKGLTAEEWLDRGLTSHSHKATGNLAFSKSRCCRAVTGLRKAVTIGSVPMIKLLCRLGHDINGVDSRRRTALYYAAKKHMLPIMDVLLDLGADPNILPWGRQS